MQLQEVATQRAYRLLRRRPAAATKRDSPITALGAIRVFKAARAREAVAGAAGGWGGGCGGGWGGGWGGGGKGSRTDVNCYRKFMSGLYQVSFLMIFQFRIGFLMVSAQGRDLSRLQACIGLPQGFLIHAGIF